jgi:hypothetical protein
MTQTQTQTLTDQSPSEVDAIGYAAYVAMNRALDKTRQYLMWMSQALRLSRGTRPEAILEAARTASGLDSYGAASLQRYLDRYEDETGKVQVARAETDLVHEEWDRRGR